MVISYFTAVMNLTESMVSRLSDPWELQRQSDDNPCKFSEAAVFASSG